MTRRVIAAGFAWAALLAMVASSVDALPALIPGAGRAGLQWGGLFAGVAIGLAGLAVIRRPELGTRVRPLATPLAALTVAAAVSAIGAQQPVMALAWAARIGLVGGLLLALLTLRPTAPTATPLLRRGAALLIGLWAALWLVAQVVPDIRQIAYELGNHQHIGGLGRFSGLSSSPTTSAELLLAAVAMVQAMPHRGWRLGLSATGLALAALSLSVATLSIPLALIVSYVRPRRLRRLLAIGWVCASLTVMYVHPVQLVVAGHELYRGALHPSWAASGLGPVHTPLRTMRVGDSSFTGHRSHYWQCVRGNLQCLAAHPLNGVGGMNFRVTCPVTTMDSYGAWLTGRRPHNQYLALGSEHGLLGLLAGLWLLLAFRRRTRLPTGAPLQNGLLWAYVFCGMQGDVWLQLCTAAWLGTSLELRDEP